MNGKKAVFLDRDGTLNEDPGYLSHPDQLILLPTVGEALRLLTMQGFQLVIVSNQSGVGRGLIDIQEIPRIHARLESMLAPFQVHIRHFELCFHPPQDNCPCRKPKPQLLLNAAQSLQLNVAESYMVGDKISDVYAGRAAGCKKVILVRTGEGASHEALLKQQEADFIGDSLLDVAQWIVNQESVTP